MKNHDEKTKDMIESVLPSTARKGSRQRRRQIHKAQRARQRDALGKFDAAADPDDFDPDFWEERRLRDTVEMVEDRRAADKIGPIARWAIATVDADPELREAPLREQIDYFAAMLPADLIGRHAVAHIEWALRAHARRRDRSDWRAAAQERCEREREEIVEHARRILGAGKHHALNRELRKTYGVVISDDGAATLGPPGRLLAGAHDVDDFAEAVTAFPQVRQVIADVAAQL